MVKFAIVFSFAHVHVRTKINKICPRNEVHFIYLHIDLIGIKV